MRKLILGFAAAAALLVSVGSASASPPKIVTTSVNATFPDPYYTNLCGFAVDFFNVGTFDAKLYLNRSGAIIREIDTTRGDMVGWNSPATATSIVFPGTAQLTTDYPNGTTPGSAVTVTGSGISAKIPGIPADAGQAVFAGHVGFIDPDGVPIVFFDQLISTTGHSNDPAAFDAAVCAALSP